MLYITKLVGIRTSNVLEGLLFPFNRKEELTNFPFSCPPSFSASRHFPSSTACYATPYKVSGSWLNFQKCIQSSCRKECGIFLCQKILFLNNIVFFLYCSHFSRTKQLNPNSIPNIIWAILKHRLFFIKHRKLLKNMSHTLNLSQKQSLKPLRTKILIPCIILSHI